MEASIGPENVPVNYHKFVYAVVLLLVYVGGVMVVVLPHYPRIGCIDEILKILFYSLESFQEEWNPIVCVVLHPQIIFLQKHMHGPFITRVSF